jgi:hypothetical protein
MKEQDVRQRIESFLKRTARDMIIPATAGQKPLAQKTPEDWL